MPLERLQPSVTVAWASPLSGTVLWPVLSNPLLQAGFSTELQAVRIIDGGPVRLGSRFEGDQVRGERIWTTISTVTAFEVEQEFAWTVASQEDGVTPVTTWTISIVPTGARTRLQQAVVLHGGPSPLTSYVTEHPELMFDVVGDLLALLAGNMLRSLRGLEELAAASQ